MNANRVQDETLSTDEWISGSVRLNLFNNAVAIEINVPAKPVKLRRMLPVFQSMTDFVIDATTGLIEARGAKISCQAGCSACCHQLIPVSEAEAYQLQELVENLPEPNRTQIRARFAAVCRELHEIGWLERMRTFLFQPPDVRRQLAIEYFGKQIPCPFLENDCCSIRSNRPLACREHLVVSPAENCFASGAEIEEVNLPLKISTVLVKMDFSAERLQSPFVPLVQALEWTEKRPEKEVEKSGPEWMNQFFALLSN